MLPKKRRIPTPLLFGSIKKSKVFFSPNLILRVHFLSTLDLQPAKITIITPAKVSRRAVDRHLIKRRISACLEKELNLIKPGRFLVWQVKNNITDLSPTELSGEICNLLKISASI